MEQVVAMLTARRPSAPPTRTHLVEVEVGINDPLLSTYGETTNGDRPQEPRKQEMICHRSTFMAINHSCQPGLAEIKILDRRLCKYTTPALPGNDRGHREEVMAPIVAGDQGA